MTKIVPWLALVACGSPPATSTIQSALTAVIDNGSFETGDYAGWTLAEDSGVADRGTWAIVGDGQVISAGQSVFDFFDATGVVETSPGLPATYQATDGGLLAVQLQNGPEDHRMFQTVAMPTCQPVLRWDMAYWNHGDAFDPSSQFFAVNVRDPETDAVLATPFKTAPGDSPQIGMSAFQVDLAAFAGQTVRIDFELQVQGLAFDAAFDNIRVLCRGLDAQPGTIDFGFVPVATMSPMKLVIVTNGAADPRTLSAI